MDFFRKQLILNASSAESFNGPVEGQSMKALNHAGGLDMEQTDTTGFIIHDLSKEPSSTSESTALI